MATVFLLKFFLLLFTRHQFQPWYSFPPASPMLILFVYFSQVWEVEAKYILVALNCNVSIVDYHGG
jgi:hypothetical protein